LLVTFASYTAMPANCASASMAREACSLRPA